MNICTVRADLTDDGAVDIDDLHIFAQMWLAD